MFLGECFLQVPVNVLCDKIQDFPLLSSDSLPLSYPSRRIGSDVILWTSMSADLQSC